jgi:hypothetical protein
MGNDTPHDPLDFMKSMWGNMGFSLPGMVTPTFDVDEIEKRIHDLKAVEGWLRMNLSMLQMTIQSLEMQRSTLTAVRAMGQMASERGAAAASPNEGSAPEDGANPFAQAAMWPWSMMQQMQAQMAQQAQQAPAQEEPATDPAAEPEATKAAVRKAKK